MSLQGVLVAGVCAAAAVAVPALVWNGDPTDLEFRGRDVVVARVVDGDTVVMATGERIRLIGIDTPERGECGAQKATRVLRAGVEGRVVRLADPEAVDDVDRYGRLLRYVEVGGADAGYDLVAAGLAIARYDGRDGFAAHPRQARYRAADRASESACERRERLRQRRREAQHAARRAGIVRREGETSVHLLRRALAVVAAQRRAQAALVAEQRTGSRAEPQSGRAASPGGRGSEATVGRRLGVQATAGLDNRRPDARLHRMPPGLPGRSGQRRVRVAAHPLLTGPASREPSHRRRAEAA